jgi:two-component system LytT family response regulator
MHRFRTFIVDDELLARERLRGFLREEPEVEIVGECAEGNEAVACICGLKPDLVFLDMQMAGCNGLQVIARLPEENRPAIIFATAHERFALEAFAVGAVDYLLKPFDRARFQQAVHRAQEYLESRDTGASLARPPTAARRVERLAIKADGRILFLRPEEIIWIESDDNHVVLHLSTGRLVVRETMGAIEARLGFTGFTRVNRSALVQLDQIRELQPALHGDHVVVLRDGTKLPLSRSLRGQLGKFAAGGS